MGKTMIPELKNLATIIDVETTGLMETDAAPLDKQPRIIELAVLTFDFETMEERNSYTTLINPGKKIPSKVTKITGITDEMVEHAPSFAQEYPNLCGNLVGSEYLIAHNLGFDSGVLEYELRRISKQLMFPWPYKHICTVEQTMHRHNKRMKQESLYEELFGEKFEGSHRANVDVEALFRIVKQLKINGEIEL